MKEATILQETSRILSARLPAGWKQRVTREQAQAQTRPDATLDVTGPDGTKARLSVEAKSGLVPRGVAALKARLSDYSSNPGLVAVPFLSRSTRDRLRAENINFLDLTGNVRLVLSQPGLYVETQGAEQDPSPKRQPGRSLRGAKAARIVRALCDFPPPFPISKLADQAKVDISYASRLVEWLSREALLERRPRGPVQSVDIAALIRRWAQDYAVLTSNDASSFLAPKGVENVVRALSEGAVRGNYALTGSVAANRIAPIAPARLAMLYVDDVESAAAALKVRAAETGANVMLLTPFDDVVFERTWKDRSLRIVAASQVAVDLLTSPGRAPRQAEAILEQLAGNDVTDPLYVAARWCCSTRSEALGEQPGDLPARMRRRGGGDITIFAIIARRQRGIVKRPAFRGPAAGVGGVARPPGFEPFAGLADGERRPAQSPAGSGRPNPGRCQDRRAALSFPDQREAPRAPVEPGSWFAGRLAPVFKQKLDTHRARPIQSGFAPEDGGKRQTARLVRDRIEQGANASGVSPIFKLPSQAQHARTIASSPPTVGPAPEQRRLRHGNHVWKACPTRRCRSSHEGQGRFPLHHTAANLLGFTTQKRPSRRGRHERFHFAAKLLGPDFTVHAVRKRGSAVR